MSPSALADVTNRVIALSLNHWPSRNTIPEAATTDLLRLFHGRFGKYLGIYQVAWQIPKTVNTLVTHAGNVTDALPGDIDLRPALRVEHKAVCLRRALQVRRTNTWLTHCMNTSVLLFETRDHVGFGGFLQSKRLAASNLLSVRHSCAISRTRRWKASFRTMSSVEF